MDLTLKTGNGLFNHRVAGVIVKNNKLLAQVNTDTNEYYLVGGRVQFGESSEEALVREIKEELGINITNYKPIWVNECFFNIQDIRFHEIGIYYLVNIDNTGFCHYDSKFATNEFGKTNYYEWLDINNLNNIVLYPQFIKNEIKEETKNLKLIITREA